MSAHVWHPYKDPRTALAVPEELRDHFVLHIKAYRGVIDDSWLEGKKQISRRRWKQARGILRREGKVEKTCLIDCDTESLPYDFADLIKQALGKDLARRKAAFEAGQMPNPLTGLGIWFTVLAPLDEQGMPTRRLRCPLGSDEFLIPVNREGAHLSPALVASVARSGPAIFPIFIRAGEEAMQLPFLLKVTAGFGEHEKTISAVRQRLIDTLHI